MADPAASIFPHPPRAQVSRTLPNIPSSSLLKIARVIEGNRAKMTLQTSLMLILCMTKCLSRTKTTQTIILTI